MNDFYDDMSLNSWQELLGKGMHYHCGDFTDLNPNSEDSHIAFERSVRQLYPYIPLRSNIIDIGCGWGGPANLIRAETASNVTCLTPSPDQSQYCRKLGFTVIQDTAESYFGNNDENEEYDIALCIEAFTHFQDQTGVLRNINAETLVMLVNCSTVSQTNKTFHMTIPTPKQLRLMITEAGWNLEVFRNTRKDNGSNKYWQRRMRYINRTPHLKALQRHNLNAIACGQDWVDNSPVMLVVAHRNSQHITTEISVSQHQVPGVDVDDYEPCLMQHMSEIRDYFNTECNCQHPFKYGTMTTYGKLMINQHPPCINSIIEQYKLSSCNYYLVSFNRYIPNEKNEEDKEDKDKFIGMHYDKFKGMTPIRTTICHIEGSFPYGGEFMAHDDENEAHQVQSLTGRIISFGGELYHGARYFRHPGKRTTVAFAQFKNKSERIER